MTIESLMSPLLQTVQKFSFIDMKRSFVNSSLLTKCGGFIREKLNKLYENPASLVIAVVGLLADEGLSLRRLRVLRKYNLPTGDFYQRTIVPEERNLFLSGKFYLLLRLFPGAIPYTSMSTLQG